MWELPLDLNYGLTLNTRAHTSDSHEEALNLGRMGLNKSVLRTPVIHPDTIFSIPFLLPLRSHHYFRSDLPQGRAAEVNGGQ